MAAHYPKNGCKAQAPYLNFSKAPPTVGWHGPGMADDAPFDPELVRQRMKEMGVTQTALATELGFTSQSAISNLLTTNPNKKPRKASAHEAAAIYRYLVLAGPPRSQLVPIIGMTAAGGWKEAIRLPLGTMVVPPGHAGKHSFAVEIHGDSMDQYVPDGGYAVIDPDQRQLFDGKSYLVANEEHDVTLKRYRGNPARFEPVSSNTEHETIFVGETKCRVVGRVVWRGAPD